MERNYSFIFFILYYNLIKTEAFNNACNCYILGTVSSIESKSLCDSKTQQCKCYSNVIGKNCDKCAEGFYNILSGNGCSNCHCSETGSYNLSCNAFTGQCYCKIGFTGLRCDQCKAYMHKLQSNMCASCNCNPYGSKDLQCNEVGQCPCISNTEGVRCNQCKENMHDIKQGCVPCQACYKLVQDKNEHFKKYLSATEKIISELENNLPSHIKNYEQFLNEINDLNTKISKLKLKYEQSKELNFLGDNLSNLTKIVKDAHDEAISLSIKVKQEFDHEKINSTVNIGHTNYEEAKSLFSLCKTALNNATLVSKQLHRHSKTMTNLAQNAEMVLKKIEENLKVLDSASEEANFTCSKACNNTNTLYKAQQILKKKYEKLKSEVLNSSNGVDTIKTSIEGINKKVKDTKGETTMLENEVNDLIIPNTGTLTESAKLIKEDFNTIKEMMRDLDEQSKEINRNAESLNQIFNQLQNEQTLIDHKVSVMQSYSDRADTAINSINDIWDIENINFDEYTKMIQSLEDSLKYIPEIEMKIKAVNDNSEEIKNIIEELLMIEKDAENMRQKLNTTLIEAQKHKATLLYNTMLLNELEKQQEKMQINLEKQHARLKNARYINSELDELNLQIINNITAIREYIIFLNSLPLTNTELNEIEKEIDMMEEMINTVQYLTIEEEILKKKVQNVKDILESIPIDDANLCETAKSEPKLNA